MIKNSKEGHLLPRYIAKRINLGGVLPNDGYITCVPKNIHIDVSIVGNIGAGLDSLHSFSLPANSLKNNNDFVKIYYSGRVAENDNNKRWLFSIDAQTILDTGLRDIDGSSFNLKWSAECTIIRLSSTTVRSCSELSVVFIHTDSAGTVVSIGGGLMVVQGNDLTVSNLNNNAVSLLVQAEGTANDDVTQELSLIDLTRF